MKHTLFGEVAEDEDGVIKKLNGAIVDEMDRPLQNIRIRRTVILDDPFPDPDGIEALIPETSPVAVYEFGDRLEEDWKPAEDDRCVLAWNVNAADACYVDQFVYPVALSYKSLKSLHSSMGS